MTVTTSSESSPSITAGVERASSLLRSGTPVGRVERELQAIGFAPDVVTTILDRLPDHVAYARRRSDSKRELFNGLGFFIFGVGATLFGYLNTARGNTYLILFGPVIYGSYRLLRGFRWRFAPPPPR